MFSSGAPLRSPADPDAPPSPDSSVDIDGRGAASHSRSGRQKDASRKPRSRSISPASKRSQARMALQGSDGEEPLVRGPRSPILRKVSAHDVDVDENGVAPPKARQGEADVAHGRRIVPPHEFLLRAMPLGPQILKLIRRPLFQFLAAQLVIIWAVAFVVLLVHDYAVQIQPKQKTRSALGQQSLLEQLSRRLKDRCPLQGPVCKADAGALGHGFYSTSAHPTRRRTKPQQGDASSGRPQRRAGKGAGSAAATAAEAVAGEEDPQLPTVFFFAGVEGTGHKFFEQVFRHLPVNFSVVAFEPDLHLTAETTQTHVHGEDVRCPLLPYPRPLRSFAKELLTRLRDVGPGPYLRARDSYPLGRVRTPLARPDLLHLLQLDGQILNLKVVVLQRGLADAVRSAYRMGYHGGDVGLQARIVEDEMAFLDTSIRLIPCGKYITLDFDWIADDPLLVAGPLAEFVGMGVVAEDVVRAVLSAKQTKPSHRVEYPEFGGQPMDEYFALRSEMWPLLAACRLTPYFWPHHPRDWPEESEDALSMLERRRGYDFEE